MKTIRYAMAAGAALLIASATAGAQLPGRTGMPRGSMSTTGVPAGMCRIWIDGVPADRQPAPTSCDVARARVPANGHIIYGTGAQGTIAPQYPVYGSAGQYDPRRDPRNSQYDPRLDRRSGRYDSQYDGQYSRQQAKIRQQYLKKQAKERDKYQRQMDRAGDQQSRSDMRGNGNGNGNGQGRGHGNGHGNNGDRDHDHG